MSTKEYTIEELRRVLSEDPSAEGWGRVRAIVENLEGAERALAFDYAQSHLQTWPASVCCYKKDNRSGEALPPWWPLVKTLEVSWTDDQGSAILRLLHPDLLRLRLCAELDDEGFIELLNSPRLGKLTHLSIDELLTLDSVAKLAAVPATSQLTHLAVFAPELGEEGVEALAPLIGRLKVLSIPSASLWSEGGLALARTSHQLERLFIRFNGIRDAALIELVGSSDVGGLTHLDLAGNQLRSEGLEALIASPHLSALRHLNLANNFFTDDDAARLANSELLARLESIDLDNNPIGSEPSDALVKSEGWEGIERWVSPGNILYM